MEFDSFNLNGRILPIEIINLIFRYIYNFDEILKFRILNKFNKLLIDQTLHLYYNQLRQFNNQLPIIELKNLNLEQKTRNIISSYNIEELRQKVIISRPYYRAIRYSALKGHDIFKKFLKLKNIGFCDTLSNLMAQKFNFNQIKEVIKLKKLGIDKHGCMNLVENFDNQQLKTAVYIINKGFNWCYASLGLRKFNLEQIDRMIKLKEIGLTDTQAYHKIEISVYIDLDI
jgi:hypothetical protein